MNLDETKGITAVMILEAIGKPPEHLKEALDKLVMAIGEEKKVKILGKKINEPVLMKDQKDFYTSFAEIEIEVEEVLYLAVLMFKYMPAHIEIISPEVIALTSNGWNDLFNELTRRLHGYDEVARVVQVEKEILEKKLRSLLEEKKEDVKEKVRKKK
ncbi:MAG: hypothetical protein ABIH49_01775 [archaeon]